MYTLQKKTGTQFLYWQLVCVFFVLLVALNLNEIFQFTSQEVAYENSQLLLKSETMCSLNSHPLVAWAARWPSLLMGLLHSRAPKSPPLAISLSPGLSYSPVTGPPRGVWVYSLCWTISRSYSMTKLKQFTLKFLSVLVINFKKRWE